MEDLVEDLGDGDGGGGDGHWFRSVVNFVNFVNFVNIEQEPSCSNPKCECDHPSAAGWDSGGKREETLLGRRQGVLVAIPSTVPAVLCGAVQGVCLFLVRNQVHTYKPLLVGPLL